MPIIIKKRAVKPQPAPEALVDPRPETVAKSPEPQPERIVTERTPYAQMPIASSIEEMFASGGKMRAPEPSVCKFCGHLYGFPCHGENPKCMNAQFVRDHGKEVANA